METVCYGKKRYFILLSLSVITTLILPLLRNLFSIVVVLNHSADLNGTVTNIVYHIGDFSAYAGSAVLIFAAIRYRSKLCLPFVAVAILESMIWIVVADAYVSNGLKISSIAYSIIYILPSWVLLFAYIGIAKSSAKYIKKEFIVVLVTFLGMLIASLFVSTLTAIVYYYLNPQLYQTPITASSGSSFDIVNIMKRDLTRSLRGYLYITAAYLIIRLVFTDNKHEKLFKILSITKTTAKNLWESTAK